MLSWIDAKTTTPDSTVHGGKGAGLIDLMNAGAPVPEFIILPTSLCVDFMADPVGTSQKVNKLAADIIDHFVTHLGHLPMLSVRSGARVSMPGMMDTILNVGVMDKLTDKTKSYMTHRQYSDCVRRFIQMYCTTAVGAPGHHFEEILSAAREKAGVESDAELNSTQMSDVVMKYKQLCAALEIEIPMTAHKQLVGCIIAVLRSWNSERAIAYRVHNKIPHEWGTAVVVQRMVFGNMNAESGSGVLFTRDPITGKDQIIAEYLPNAQGEDVVAGIRTPEKLDLPNEGPGIDHWKDHLFDYCYKLEQFYKDMLDIEFTVENNKLYLLQVRKAKRSARAWVRSTLDFHKSKLIDLPEVRNRIKVSHVKMLLSPVVDPGFTTPSFVTGIPACSGVVTGKAVFTVKQALDSKVPCILVRHETSPDDIEGMIKAVGVLTATGGITSHAAVVARGMDKVCVVGCGDLTIKSDIHADTPSGGITAGDMITLDGTTGRVWVNCEVPVSDPSNDPDLIDLTKRLVTVKFDYEPCFPNNPGNVLYLSQFSSRFEPDILPGAKQVHVIADTMHPGNDPVIDAFGQSTHGEAMSNLVEWAKTTKAKITLHTVGTQPLPGSNWPGNLSVVDYPSEEELVLSTPVTPSDIERVFGQLDKVERLIHPVKLHDKFKLLDCTRYSLLAGVSED